MNTDERGAYNHLAEAQRKHVTVCHHDKEWARDDDGDGVREVHCNTMEGIWTGLRNSLGRPGRPFRGIIKHHLAAYVAIFEWTHNVKAVTTELVHTMCRLHL